MAQKIDTSHVSKFDGTYLNIWKHRLTLIFKAEKLWSLVDGTEVKPVAPTAAQITAGTPPLPVAGAGSISAWEDRDMLALTIINNGLDNSVVSHIQSCKTAALAWTELIRLFESQDAVTKMYLKDKLHTLKMRENDSVTKHIHVFRAHLEQLFAAGAAVPNDEAVLTLMRSMPPSYRMFISSLRRQPNLTLQSLITDLIQEETLMKNLNLSPDNTSALYTRKSGPNYSRKSAFNRNPKKFLNSKGESSSKNFATKKPFFDKKCFYCKKTGHMIKDCRTRIAAEAINSNNQSNVVTKVHKLYVAALIVKEESDSTWYIDTGATQHMCFEKDSFTNYEPYNKHQLVYLGDNSTHRIQGQGYVTVTLLNGQIKQIPDVLYIPGLRKNLFSAKQFDKVGGELHIKSGICTLTNQ